MENTCPSAKTCTPSMSLKNFNILNSRHACVGGGTSISAAGDWNPERGSYSPAARVTGCYGY